MEVGRATQTVEREYLNLIARCGTEFDILLKTPEEQLRGATGAKIADGILRMRRGEVAIEPGYDGEYGKVRLFGGAETPAPAGDQQLSLF